MKFKYKLITYVIGFCLLGTYAIAADNSINSKLDQSAPFKFTINRLGTANYDNANISDEIKFSVNEVQLHGIFATFNAGAGKFIMAGDFRYTQFRYVSDQIDDKDLYEVSMPMTYITAPSTWQHIINISPSINSDFKKISEDDFKLSTYYQAQYNSSKMLTWVLGLGFGYQFGDLQAYPILGIIYRPNSQWHFNIVFPQLKISYTASQKSLWYFSANPTGRTWNVEREDKSGNVDIVMKEIRVVVGTVYEFDNALALRAEIGGATGRNLNFTRDNGHDDGLNIDDAIFTGLSLEYRF